MGKNTTNDMTQGNCMRLLVQFFLPILAGNLFQQLYSFADSMVVGKGIGDTALAAVGNTSSVHFLIIGFAIGLTGGLGICISQSFGSGNYEKLRKELAKIAHMSSSYFMSCFKQNFGLGAIEYLNQVRIRSACDLLRNTDRSISDIAFDTGFHNLSNFNRQFRTKVGCFPQTYRKESVLS